MSNRHGQISLQKMEKILGNFLIPKATPWKQKKKYWTNNSSYYSITLQIRPYPCERRWIRWWLPSEAGLYTAVSTDRDQSHSYHHHQDGQSKIERKVQYEVYVHFIWYYSQDIKLLTGLQCNVVATQGNTRHNRWQMRDVRATQYREPQINTVSFDLTNI